jgi:hypothetical protein
MSKFPRTTVGYTAGNTLKNIYQIKALISNGIR